MTVEEFIERRRAEWTELEQLLSPSPDGQRLRQSAAGASRLSLLLRSACSDLARARAAGYSDDLIDYLNALTARAHNLFYVAPPVPLYRVVTFFTEQFPLAVRRNAVYVVAGLLLFYVPLAGTLALASVNEEALYELVPKQTLESFERMYKRGHAAGRGEQTDLMMAGFYVRNNIGIAFQCFAAGIFFGLGSIFVLLFNGIMIGATLGFVGHTPSAMNLLSFIAGHSAFELTAIALAGAGGLRLGFGPIITGERRRIDSLRLAAREAVELVLGAAALLLGAALIEGFFSPSSLPPLVKAVVGGLAALSLTWYLGLYSARCARRARGREELA